MEGLDVTSFWSDKRVLLTGATGLVGSWLTKALVGQSAQVVVLVRDADPQSELYRSGTITRASVVSGRVEDFGTIERALSDYEIDTVFHLAAQALVGSALRAPLLTFESNIRGTYNMLEACRLHPQVRRVIVASSDKAYGTTAELPYTEEMPLRGRHPYDVSKSCADLLAQAYAHTYDLPVAVARNGNIYGGGDLNWSRIVPGTIRSGYLRERPIVRSDGTYVRDYIYVEDVVDGYLALGELLTIKALFGEAFNFSSESPMTVLEIVKTIVMMMGHPELTPVILDEAPGEIKAQYLSSKKAHATLEWSPRHTLSSGLSKAIAWYQAFFSQAAAQVIQS